MCSRARARERVGARRAQTTGEESVGFGLGMRMVSATRLSAAEEPGSSPFPPLRYPTHHSFMSVINGGR